MKIIPLLKDIYENDKEFNGILSSTNIDDVFKKIVSNKIYEVIVNRKEMVFIAQFFIANATPMEGQSLDWEKIDWLVWRVLGEGKIDKFFGVKLLLKE